MSEMKRTAEVVLFAQGANCSGGVLVTVREEILFTFAANEGALGSSLDLVDL